MFTLKSFVFTLFSPAFYKDAVLNRSTKRAIGTACIFIVLITILQALYFAISFGVSLISTPKDFQNFPEVSVDKENGLSILGLDMPFVSTDGGQYFAIDTSGEIKEIPMEFSEGLLLTKNEVIIREKQSYDDLSMPYSEILTSMERDEIQFGSEEVSKFVQSFGLILICIAPFAIFAWELFTKFFVIFIVSIIGALVLSLMKQEMPFERSFKLACYAMIPATYIGFILGLINTAIFEISGMNIFSLCCLIPLIIWIAKWSLFWGMGAYGISKN